MQSDQVERLLRHWGRVYGWGKPDEWDEDETQELGGKPHPLVAAQRIDGRSELKMAGELAALRRRLRRRAQAQARKTDTFHDPRELAAEHVCYGVESRGGVKPMKKHPDADWVDSLVLRMYQDYPVQAVIIRIEYCTYARHKAKAAWAGQLLDNPHLKLKYYRDQLAMARVWMAGAMSAGREKKSASVT